MTPEQASETRRLERYRRYNRSAKGAKRYRAYEEKHPDRAARWSPIMLAKRARGS